MSGPKPPSPGGPTPPVPAAAVAPAAADAGGAGGISLSMPIILGALVVGAGVLALVYMKSTSKGNSPLAVEAESGQEPKAKEGEEAKEGVPTDPECVWPCPQSKRHATGPCPPRNFACESED